MGKIVLAGPMPIRVLTSTANEGWVLYCPYHKEIQEDGVDSRLNVSVDQFTESQMLFIPRHTSLNF